MSISMIYLVLSALIVIADQVVKYLVVSHIAIGETEFSILNLFSVTYVKNEGAAFSMLSGKVPVLSIVSVLFCIGVIVYWIWKKPKNKMLCTSIALMFSGALGNAIDRICRGFVVDFINAKFISFPVFNIADTAIVIGAILLVVYEILFDKKENNKEDKNADDNS